MRDLDIDAIYPLSPLQQGMLFHTLLNPDGGLYFQQASYTLRGDLDRAALERAWNAVVRRHDVLRTAFAWEGLAEMRQIVFRDAPLELEAEDWRDTPEHDRAARLRRFLEADRRRGFDLATPPLMRLILLTLDRETSYLVWSHHHILLDGWSVALLFDEVAHHYRAECLGEPAGLAAARPYREYIGWLNQQSPERAERFWRDYLAGLAERSPVTSDIVEGFEDYGETGELIERLPASLVDRLSAFAREHQITVNSLAQGAWSALLAARNGRADVLFGATVSGRPPALAGVEQMVGLFINTIPVRASLTPETSVVDWLRALQYRQVQAREFEHTPLFAMQQWTDLSRGAPLFDSIIVFENYPTTAFKDGYGESTAARAIPRGSFEVESHPLLSDRAKYPFTLLVKPGRGLTLRVLYDPRVLSETAARERLTTFASLLEAIVARPEQPVAALLVSIDARAKAKASASAGAGASQAGHTDASATGVNEERDGAPREATGAASSTDARERAALDEELTTHAHLFEALAAIVAAQPDAVAIADDAGAVTYAALHERARTLGRALRARGVGADVCVAVATARGRECILGMLGALAAGGAYVPVDLAWPLDRIGVVFESAPAAVVLTTRDARGRLPGHWADVIALDDPASWGAPDADLELDLDLTRHADASRAAVETHARLSLSARSGALAYVMYTSGSTGRPKGVGVAHAQVLHYVRGLKHELGTLTRAVWGWQTTVAADLGYTAVWGSLLNGGRLEVADEETAQSVARYGEWMTRTGVECVKGTPTQLRLLAGADGRGLPQRAVIVGGEASLPSWVAQWRAHRPGLRVWNHYGPTECTVGAVMGEVPAQLAISAVRDAAAAAVPAETLPLGRPLQDTRVLVMDAQGTPSRPGTPGELWIAGGGVARGYIGQPAETARRFTPDPFAETPGARVYRTGDRVRRGADDQLEFLGRVDAQVKVRGYRVEPGEIEAALASHAGVRQCAIAARPRGPGEVEIAAYVVPASSGAGESAWRAHLAERLPAYMMPTSWTVLDALPLMPNGKIDRRALPAPSAPMRESAIGLIPRTPWEEVVAAIWAEVLHVPTVGISDDFFALGGHSLLATQCIARLRQTCGVDVALRVLFETPTVAALALAVEAAWRGESVATAPMLATPASEHGDTAIPASFVQARAASPTRAGENVTSRSETPASAVAAVAATTSIRHADAGVADGAAVSGAQETIVLRWHGPLDVAALARSIDDLDARHDLLRTRVVQTGSGPTQLVLPRRRLRLPVIDASQQARAGRTALLPHLATAGLRLACDITTGDTWRALLLRTSAVEHDLIVTWHRSIGDAWSIRVLCEELAAGYAAHVRGHAPERAPLTLQYADYARWQHASAGSAAAEAIAASAVLSSHRAPAGDGRVTLSSSAARAAAPSSNRSHVASIVRFTLDRAVTLEMRALARREIVTSPMVWLAALQAVLAGERGLATSAIAIALANRTRPETAALIGTFAASAQVRVDLTESPTFRDLLARARTAVLDAWTEHDLPRLDTSPHAASPVAAGAAGVSVSFRALPSRLTVTPDVSLSVERSPVARAEAAGQLADEESALVASVTEEAQGFDVLLAARPGAFGANGLQAFTDRLQRFLEEAISDPDLPIDEYPVEDEAERRSLLVAVGSEAARASSVAREEGEL